MSAGLTLDELAEQALQCIRETMDEAHVIDQDDTKRIIREALEAATQAQREQLEQTQKELEDERIRLAACTTAALSNTDDARAGRLASSHPYYSASYGDVCRAVDREIAQRQRAEKAEQQLAQMTQERTQLLEWRDGAMITIDRQQSEYDALKQQVRQLMIDAADAWEREGRCRYFEQRSMAQVVDDLLNEQQQKASPK